MLCSTLVGLVHVIINTIVSGILAFVRRMRVHGIPGLLSDHHFDPVATDHLTVEQVDSLPSRLSTRVLHVAIFPPYNTQEGLVGGSV